MVSSTQDQISSNCLCLGCCNAMAALMAAAALLPPPRVPPCPPPHCNSSFISARTHRRSLLVRRMSPAPTLPPSPWYYSRRLISPTCVFLVCIIALRGSGPSDAWQGPQWSPPTRRDGSVLDFGFTLIRRTREQTHTDLERILTLI
jgi:hypothetical protein